MIRNDKIGIRVALCLLTIFALFVVVAPSYADVYKGYVKTIQADSGYLVGYPLRYYVYDENGVLIGYVGRHYDEENDVDGKRFNALLNTAFSTGCQVEIAADSIYKGYFVNVQAINLAIEDSYSTKLIRTTDKILAILKKVFRFASK